MISSRKSLVSSLRSHSFQSLPETPRSRKASKSIVDASVDELFVQYSVPQVQKLQREYKANLSQAKDDLHRLVGEKYRDLIRIAEDINEMSSLSHEIDTQLTDLSYRSSNFVEFGKNSFGKFDSAIRKEKARLSRASSHKTILNNVINNKLITYDLKLQTDSVKKTSTLVSVAKLYYTISVVFGETLKKNPHVSANLLHLRANFIQYLENKLSVFSSSVSDFGTKGLDVDSFFMDKVDLAASEGENFDLFTGSFDEDDQELSDDEDMESSATLYRGSTYPIVNYLIAYIIVNHDNPELDNLQKITSKFINLRYNFLESFVKKALKTGNHEEKVVNFTMIFQYIESTCAHMQRYFVSDDMISNDLQNQLKYVVSWKASDLIGFHNWFNDETVDFDNYSYQVLDHKAVAAVQAQLLKFGEFVYRLGSRLVFETHNGSTTQKASSVLNLFYNFVLGLRKSEVIFLSNAGECHCIRLISEENAVSKLLADVVEVFESCFTVHRTSLTGSDTSVLRHITNDLENESLLSSAVELFTPDFANLIDVDVDKYFDSVIDISSSSNTVSELEKRGNSCLELKHWFYVLQELLEATNNSGDNGLTKILRMLSKDFKEVNGVSKSWGDFDSENFLSSFQKVRTKQIESVRMDIQSFINNIAEAMNTSVVADLSSRLHFLLNLFIILTDNLAIIEENSTSSLLYVEVGKQVLAIYKQIFAGLISHVPKGSSTAFGALIKELSNTESVATRPHLAFHSSMFELAVSLLESPRFRQHEMCYLYTDPGVKDKFVSEKNRWIREDIIEKGLVSSFGDSVKLVHSNGAHGEETAEKSTGERTAEEGKTTEEEKSTGEQENEEEAEKTDNAEEAGEAQPDEEEDAWAEDDGWAEDDPIGDDPIANDAAISPEKVEVNETEREDSQEENGGAIEQVDVNGERKESAEDNFDDQGAVADIPEDQHSNGSSIHKDTIAQASQIIANIVFLLNFTAEGTVTASDDLLQRILSTLESTCSVKLEASTVESILRGVNEFYRASKEMYLPLLVN